MLGDNISFDCLEVTPELVDTMGIEVDPEVTHLFLMMHNDHPVTIMAPDDLKNFAEQLSEFCQTFEEKLAAKEVNETINT